jgi:hypothetical protein
MNGMGERPHRSIAEGIRAMIGGSNLDKSFWVYAFYHYLRLYNLIPHGDRPSSPYIMCGNDELPDVSKLRTFGCRVYVRPPTKRKGNKSVDNTRKGIFLGYSRTLKVILWFNLLTSEVKTAAHARFDEGFNDLETLPPNAAVLRYSMRDKTESLDPPDLLPPINLSFTKDPFGALETITQPICCNDPNFGLEPSSCDIRKRVYVSGVTTQSTAGRIRHVRKKYIGAYITKSLGWVLHSRPCRRAMGHQGVSYDSAPP